MTHHHTSSMVDLIYYLLTKTDLDHELNDSNTQREVKFHCRLIRQIFHVAAVTEKLPFYCLIDEINR